MKEENFKEEEQKKKIKSSEYIHQKSKVKGPGSLSWSQHSSVWGIRENNVI